MRYFAGTVLSIVVVAQVFFAGLNMVNLWAEWHYSHGNPYKAVTIHPWSWRYQFKMGSLLLQANRPDLAIGPLTAAWKLFPGYFDAGNNLAIALARVGKRQEAVALLEEIVQYWPHERAMRNLARIKKGGAS